MYVRKWPDKRFEKYQDQIKALGPLNFAQRTYHLYAEDDDPSLTDEDVIPMCKMLEVKVDLRRSNILFTAERDWPKQYAQKAGKRLENMSKEELAELNGEIRRVVTKKGLGIYNRKVDMTKHVKKLEAYNSRAIAYYLEHRRCKRMVAGMAELADKNNSKSDSQAEAMDQEYEDSENSTDENESSDVDVADDLGSFETVIESSAHQSQKKQHQESDNNLSFNMFSEEDENGDEDVGDDDRLVIDDDQLLTEDDLIDADKENVANNIESPGADRFIDLASRSTLISTKDGTNTETNSEPKSNFEFTTEDEEIAGFNPAVDSGDIQLANPDGIVTLYERRDNSTENISQTYTQLFGEINYVSSTQQ